jgi:hypothetical protein
MICRRWSSRRFAHDFRLKASLAVTMMSMPCCRRSRWSPHWLVCGWCRLSRMCSTKISLLYGRCRDVQRNGVGAGKSGSVISWCSGTIDGVSRCRRSPWRDRCRVESGDARVSWRRLNLGLDAQGWRDASNGHPAHSYYASMPVCIRLFWVNYIKLSQFELG